MALQKVHLVLFSATGTTSRIVSAIASGLGVEIQNTINLAISIQEPIIIPNDEIVIFGTPVFSGRVPEIAKKAFEKITGNNTPAMIVCVYGNRDFDDALLELKETVERNGFYVLSASAFIAQHSIFPSVAQGRPDEDDLSQARKFGIDSIRILDENGKSDSPLIVKGNHPYRAVKPIPITPKTNRNCNSCGKCSKECPVQAIDFNNPRIVDKNKCISCAHCISICPKHSKQFKGLLFRIASTIFIKKNSQRKEPYIIYR